MVLDRTRSLLGVPASEAVDLLDELIAKVLPPLQARVRRDRIPELATRIAALTDPREFSKSNRIGLQLAGLAVLSIRVVAQLQIELAELERRVAAHVEAYARAKTDEVRRARLEIMRPHPMLAALGPIARRSIDTSISTRCASDTTSSASTSPWRSSSASSSSAPRSIAACKPRISTRARRSTAQ